MHLDSEGCMCTDNGQGGHTYGQGKTFSPTLDRFFPAFPVEFTMLSFLSCLYLPRQRQILLSEHLVKSNHTMT